MKGGPADREPSDLAHPAESLDQRAAVQRAFRQADADYAAGNTGAEDVRDRFGLAEATPPPNRKFGQMPDLDIPDNFDDPLPGFEERLRQRTTRTPSPGSACPP